MYMLQKLYIQSICFFGLLSLIGIYIGYSKLIYPITSIGAIIISLLGSWVLTRKIKTEEIKNSKLLAGFLILFFLILIYPALPALVFPHASGDFQNHARSVRVIAKQHSLEFLKGEPQIYHAVGAMLYALFPYTYIINSALAILILLISAIGVFLISKTLYNEKVGLLATLIYSFSITNIFILEQGFFPQLLGQFFFISSIYLYMRENKIALVLSNIGLLSYPHYFGIYIIFLVLEFIKTKEWRSFLIPLISVLVALPESYDIIAGRIKFLTQYSLIRITLLARGGILTPTLFSLFILLFSMIGLYHAIKKEQNRIINMNLSVFSLMIIIVLAFSYWVLRGYTKDLHHLYMFAKMYYLLIFPLSVAGAVGANFLVEKRKFFVLSLLTFHILYFAGYSFLVLPQKASFPGEAYIIFEKMDTLPGEFKIGIDPALGTNVGWEPKFPYKSLIDLPSPAYTDINKGELNRALQFHWANYTFTNKGVIVINSKGEEIIKYTLEGVNYYITAKNLDKPMIFKEGEIKVYRMR